MALKCGKCGREIEEGTKFCPECGEPMLASVNGTPIPSFQQSVPSAGSSPMANQGSVPWAGAPVNSAPNAGGVPEKPKKKHKGLKIAAGAIALLLVLCVMAGACSDDSADAPSEGESVPAATSGSSSEESSSSDSASVKSVKATYNGSTEAGTKIDSGSDITVVATYEDGSKEQVTGWEVKSSKTLKAGETSTVSVVYGDASTKLKVKCTTQTKDQFKKSCKSVAYKTIARNPDKYEGQKIKISGKVIQVMEDGNDVTLRVATKGSYDNIYLVSYEYKKNDSKILEDDRITMWGYCTGTTTYESTMGGNITIPSMVASYYSLS